MSAADRLNAPLVERLRACAADTSPDWAGRITIYPGEARLLVALIDAAAASPTPAGQTDETLRARFESIPELSDETAGEDGCWHCDTRPGANHLASCRGPR